jgi:hypothetical protein
VRLELVELDAHPLLPRSSLGQGGLETEQDAVRRISHQILVDQI